ncbi:MAG: DUF2752 domain-containing protein [Phycisphaerae bacterium]|nr:DUF2752 domain-containing protein [Phycisphaerae bacterium]
MVAVCLLGGAAALLAVMLFAFDPATSGWFPPCLLYAATGLYCPGCGSLRGLHALLHGDILGALDLNAFMVVSLPFIAYSILRGCTEAVFGSAPRPVFLRAGWIWTMLAAIVTYGILRNVPVWPFTMLAP